MAMPMRSNVSSVVRVFRRSLHGSSASNNGVLSPNTKIAGVFGALMNRGQGKEGVRDGPNAIREAGLLTLLKDCGISFRDYGDVEIQAIASDDPWKKVKYSRTVAGGCKQIADKVQTIIRENGVPIMLGGDHASAIGSISGHGLSQLEIHGIKDPAATAPLAVLWIDAHADINTPLTTATGNLHGCPVSFLLKEMSPYIPRDIPGFEWQQPCLTADRIAYIGLRALDPDELFVMDKLKIKYFPMQDVDKLGVQKCVELALQHINPNNDLPLHLSFDIDALDPSVAFSTGTPAMGGLTLREGLQIVEYVRSTGQLSAMDLVEVNPTLGNGYQRAKTMEAACAIIAGALGKPRQAIPYKLDFDLPRPSDFSQ
ncbi:hypothetical protein RvY_10518 [Ramazzottius varieornatus]|uniref:Arginase n=1 Tax=Ramazzottius varieornatus TaxID=947166 RepID=A0A1D1VD08_RAMVA|nr:hypothetical protein RvY_10518 [Ramazzottius varieornatus]